MLSSLARPATRTLARTTRTAPSPLPAAAKAFLPPSRSCFSTTSRRASEPLPWFVDPTTAPTATPSSPSILSTSPSPTLPPSHLSPALHPLHAHLSASPFFDKDRLTYIHARERDPEGSWCDWVVIATLREGRERGIRGAAEGVRTFLAKTPIDLADPSPSSSTPLFSPSASSPLVSGLPPSPSKHARSRSRGPPPTRADQATGWAMVDAGRVVVHVMTREARETFGRGVEEVWETTTGTGTGGAEEREVRRLREEEERRRELEENMEEVRREMEVEEKAQREKA